MKREKRKEDVLEDFKQLKALLDSVDSTGEVKLKVRKEGRPRKVRRKEAREKKIPADRICPVCGSLVIKSRGWVLKYGHKAMCRSCWFKRVYSKKSKG